jgi:hypothetical protein
MIAPAIQRKVLQQIEMTNQKLRPNRLPGFFLNCLEVFQQTITPISSYLLLMSNSFSYISSSSDRITLLRRIWCRIAQSELNFDHRASKDTKIVSPTLWADDTTLRIAAFMGGGNVMYPAHVDSKVPSCCRELQLLILAVSRAHWRSCCTSRLTISHDPAHSNRLDNLMSIEHRDLHLGSQYPSAGHSPPTSESAP